MKLKAFFIIFKGLSMAKVYLKPENAPLNIVLFGFSLITFIENKIQETLGTVSYTIG